MSSRQARYAQRKAGSAASIGYIRTDGINQELKDACRHDLHRFLREYFPYSTGLKPFSPGHEAVIQNIQHCVLHGGRFVEAVFRGWAKTTIAENTMIWVSMYGHRKFSAIFGADAQAAEGNIDSIKMELAENDLLDRDFPEVTQAVRGLDGKPQRAHGQTYTIDVECIACKGQGCEECKDVGTVENEVPTHIDWTAAIIVLPEIKGYPSAGAIVTARGITAGSRGLKHKLADGTQQRPDFIFIDDPQTDESAKSPSQVQGRISIIKKNLMKMGGHGQQMAALIAGTVIEADDVMDQFLDPKKNPSWQSKRIPMVEKWADAHETMWLGEYTRLRTTYESDSPGSQQAARVAATKYYIANRTVMDAGATVAWQHCFDEENEASAIQHAYNALIDDGPEVFASEYQNQPLVAAGDDVKVSIEAISKQLNGLKQGVVPQVASRLTAFIDVQGECLFWLVLATGDDFTGGIVDYGCFPDQKRPYFSLREVKRTLAIEAQAAGVNVTGIEGSITWGLQKLTGLLLDRSWERVDGAGLRIEQCLIDANWGDSTDIVHQFCKSSPHAAILMPSHGRYIGAKARPWTEYKPKQGDRVGLNWRVPANRNNKSYVAWHTNWWKTFVQQRLKVAPGEQGSFTIFGGPKDTHRMLTEHLTAEKATLITANEVSVTEWDLRQPGLDNHWLDCLVGAAVAASMKGASLAGLPVEKQRKARKKYTASDFASLRGAT